MAVLQSFGHAQQSSPMSRLPLPSGHRSLVHGAVLQSFGHAQQSSPI
jgi:hypothetical protein